MSIELDHIFWMVPKAEVEMAQRAVEALGLKESYRRNHLGQGTSNICYCFHNAFLELLWVEDEAQARSPAIARTLLAERANGTANPFGIAWRGEAGLASWNFKPPYLPETSAIKVAQICDDPALPLLFNFPVSIPPRDFPPQRHQSMQNADGWSALRLDAIHCGPCPGVMTLAGAMQPPFELCESDNPRLDISMTGPAGHKRVSLPIPL